MLFKNTRTNYIWEKFSNVGLSLLYGWFAYIMLSNFLETERLSVFILFLYETMLVFYLLTRSIPRDVSIKFYDWVIAVAGTYASLLLRPSVDAHDMLVLQICQSAGFLISVVGLLSLNKSFGIVPANRGVRTEGIYRYIRHPLYSGYILSNLFFVLQNPTVYNTAIYAMMVCFQILRILAEEEFLSKDRTYKDYMKQTRWRLVPLIW